MFKNIDLIKKIVDKDLYTLCVIKKTHQTFYKTHIRFKEKSLNLIHFNIYDLITSRDHYNNKYFVIFFDNWNKRSEVKIIKQKNKIFFIFKRYQARNQRDDFKIHRFRIDYDEKYKRLWFRLSSRRSKLILKTYYFWEFRTKWNR